MTEIKRWSTANLLCLHTLVIGQYLVAVTGADQVSCIHFIITVLCCMRTASK